MLAEVNLEGGIATDENNDENLKQQIENANKRISNLEKFKQLFFDLQRKLTDSVAEIEALNQKIAELAEGSENYTDIMSLIEQNKTQYINMGQMIAMDKDAHHESVSSSMDYSDNLLNERKGEIARLKKRLSSQFEEIWTLQKKLSGSTDQEPSIAELNTGIEAMNRQLKDSEMCIETMDMEIQTLNSELLNLRKKLKQQDQSASQELPSGIKVTQSPLELENELKKKDQMIARFAQESKELLSCITGMEDHSDEQTEKIKQLENQLEENKDLAEKHTKLEAEYAAMEEKYLKSI